MNKNHTKWFSLTQEDKHKCSNVLHDVLLCKSIKEKITLGDPACELNILLNNGNYDECDIRILNSTKQIIAKISQTNTYMYFIPQMQTVTFECNGTEYKWFLEGAAVLHILSQCTLETNNFKITGFEEVTTVTRNYLAPIVDMHVVHVSKLIQNFTIIKNISFPEIKYTELFSPDQLRQLEEISIGTKEIKDIQLRLKQIPIKMNETENTNRRKMAKSILKRF